MRSGLRPSRPRPAAALALLASAALACGADFTPRSVVADLRVLAILASPLEAGPEDVVRVTASIVPPPAATVTATRWTFCPFSIGASVGYACAVPSCEVELLSDPDGAVLASPGALARQCLAQLAAAGAAPPGIPAQLPDQVSTVFRLVVTASDGQTREAVQPLPLYPGGAPAQRNVPPVIRSTSIGGQAVAPGDTAPALEPGRSLPFEVALDPASAQPYTGAAGEALTESLVVSFYTSAGRFDYDRASGPDASATLKYEQIGEGVTEAQLWAVARDLRGGETVVGPFTVPITPQR